MLEGHPDPPKKAPIQLAAANPHHSIHPYLPLQMVLCVVQGIVAIYFLYQAYAYLRPIMLFLAREEERERELQATDPHAQRRAAQRAQRAQTRRRKPDPVQPLRAARTEHLIRWILYRCANGS